MSTGRGASAVATFVAAAALIVGVPAASDAQSKYSIKIAFGEGRVSLFADGAPASDVLAEWSRYGKTDVIGGETVEKIKVTVALEDVSEGEALEAILGRGTAYATEARRLEFGLSSFSRLLVGEAALRKLPGVDTSVPPEARFEYTVPDKVQSGEDFGKPVYETFKELPPAPETLFDFYTPEKGKSDFGKPIYEKLDEKWQIPELRFEYLLKDFAKFDIAEFLKPPTTYPEVRFKYFCGSKAAPCW